MIIQENMHKYNIHTTYILTKNEEGTVKNKIHKIFPEEEISQ